MTLFWTIVGLYALAHGSPTLSFLCLCGWVATGREVEGRE